MAGEESPSKASEFVRKLLTVGVGAIFLTEESLRTLVKEFKLPKEILGNLLESASKTKQEFLQTFSEEILSKVSDRMDFKAYMDEFLSKNEVDLHVKIKFHPKVKK